MTHRLGKTVLHTCSDWLKPGQNFSHLFPPVHTCSQLFTPVPTCSQLFTLVHTCSQLFTPQWLYTLFAQWQFLVELSRCESCYFSILRAILLKLHIFAHLIESYPTVHDWSSSIEIKMLIPLAAHTTVTIYDCCEMSFLHSQRLLFFVLRPILLKLHILARLIESFPSVHGWCSCNEIKMSFPLGAHA